jgi:hypothetical protein
MQDMAAGGSGSKPAAAIPSSRQRFKLAAAFLSARQQKGRREAGLLSFK